VADQVTIVADLADEAGVGVWVRAIDCQLGFAEYLAEQLQLGEAVSQALLKARFAKLDDLGKDACEHVSLVHFWCLDHVVNESLDPGRQVDIMAIAGCEDVAEVEPVRDELFDGRRYGQSS